MTSADPGTGRLVGKRALVTGGGSGIGLAVARRFVAEGARVLVFERDERTADAVADAGAELVVGDVRDAEALVGAVGDATARWGGIDTVVANAGYELLGDALELTLDDWDAHQAVMLRGVYATFRAALPSMLSGGGGSLIAIGSNLSFVGLERFTSYLAAKSGVLGLVRGIAIDFGDRGVRANALCPGPTLTPLIERQLEGLPDPDAQLAAWGADTILGRLGRPDEIAAGAVFLASDEASFVTGSALVIDGGYTAR
jgi:NAD(P)-dependent dehydrogenase (short-subunit alcohol dehydrogenase family)